MKKLTLKVTGTTGLMLNNPQTVNPFNKYTKSKKEISSKRKKTEEDMIELLHLSFLASIYQDRQGNYIVPCDSFKKSFETAAKEFKLGKKFEQSMQIFNDAILEFDGNDKTPEELYNGGNSEFVDIRDAGMRSVGGSVRVTVCRFFVPVWSTTIDVFFDELQIDEAALLKIITISGMRYGVGTYRKKFGKFSVEVVK